MDSILQDLHTGYLSGRVGNHTIAEFWAWRWPFPMVFWIGAVLMLVCGYGEFQRKRRFRKFQRVYGAQEGALWAGMLDVDAETMNGLGLLAGTLIAAIGVALSYWY